MSGPLPFRVGTRITDGRVVVSVRGEIDLDTGPCLGDALEEALKAGTPGLEVDFRQVSFCDCSGLSVLLRTRAAARRAGVNFGVSGVNAPEVQRLLTLTETAPLLLLPWQRAAA
ncbi:STAS domain-containing protein [Streptomyces sp. NPDC047014]|uniref:STAS domain-containing protein n=1 Tax=Streptomyces sp. NPDC047014 TaxID=3155736 RepID=UPI0033FAF1A4